MNRANVFDELQRRGFVQQLTDPDELRELLGREAVTFYIGFDPTADSLHVGHLMGIMAMIHMQRYGHRPIAIVGGGTAMVGDPSGKTEMRKMLSREQIVENTQKIKAQLMRYLDFSEGKALLVDNYEWLGNLNYLEFLRDIGRHFSVNKMLSYETYKRRLETGLSFLEFNYQLLQAYDFYMLFKRYNCRLQMGGDDQWANILAGTDLIRRLEGVNVYGHTFPLLTTADGKKMGKTEAGALWLDQQKTPPYDYFQYWVNIDDRDVYKCLAYFTLLPMTEIERVEAMQGAELNAAKRILAYEATKLTHGEEAAKSALAAAIAAFGAVEIPDDLLPSSSIPRRVDLSSEASIPHAEISRSLLESRPLLVDLLVNFQLTSSKSEGRRLIDQGGVYLNGDKVSDRDAVLSVEHVRDNKISIRLGKKKHFNLIVI
ncbi:MAG: tyrosine--tRNA ligase [candidate division KSB1 bacterium]|nr:tyrosine--tRNA ligase [candidate division KSB1 bacterium]